MAIGRDVIYLNKSYALEEVGDGSFFLAVYLLICIFSTSPSYEVQTIL